MRYFLIITAKDIFLFRIFHILFIFNGVQDGFAVSDVRFFTIVYFQWRSRGLRRFGFDYDLLYIKFNYQQLYSQKKTFRIQHSDFRTPTSLSVSPHK